MNINFEKMQKLTDIARLYYEKDKTQNEIAAIYGISRPLVSRMLKEAKQFGIVSVTIHSPFDDKELIIHQLKTRFQLQSVVSVRSGENDNITNNSLAVKAIHYLNVLNGACLGVGWGTIIGVTASLLEQNNPQKNGTKIVCPLVGNSGVSNKNYHSNETVRIFAQQMSASPCYLYTPAFAQTQQEIELIKKLENYKSMYQHWLNLDVALVNIGNYPSVPDFASGARYGQLLQKKKAVGRLLAYYFDQNGEIITSNTDYAIQVPIEILRKCKNVIGICSSNVSPKALMGAMNTGLIHHVIAREELLKEALELSR